MASRGSEAAPRDIRRILESGTVTGMSDAQLLERFASRRDEAAFEALLRRHGPMVLGVCRRVLGNPHDAQDAFQATFLVLARKAGSLRAGDSLGPWFHGVAHRVAVRTRAGLVRWRTREKGEVLDTAGPAFDAARRDAWAVLHEEVNRLPEKYRAPIVLCYLEGLSHELAAQTTRLALGDGQRPAHEGARHPPFSPDPARPGPLRRAPRRDPRRRSGPGGGPGRARGLDDQGRDRIRGGEDGDDRGVPGGRPPGE